MKQGQRKTLITHSVRRNVVLDNLSMDKWVLFTDAIEVELKRLTDQIREQHFERLLVKVVIKLNKWMWHELNENRAKCGYEVLFTVCFVQKHRYITRLRYIAEDVIARSTVKMCKHFFKPNEDRFYGLLLKSLSDLLRIGKYRWKYHDVNDQLARNRRHLPQRAKCAPGMA